MPSGHCRFERSGRLTTEPDKEGIVNFDLAIAQEFYPEKGVLYDRDEDAHYDTASAFIICAARILTPRSIGWPRCFYAGEDPRFIARRICICASEDVGNADPRV